MIYRQAIKEDIKQIQIVRNSVIENPLSIPGSITDEVCLEFISTRGRGWVCEIDNKIVGFSIVDLNDNNIWALFIKPQFEKKGIGKELHKLMLDWYFIKTKQKVWLSTSPGTRAERFYRKAGWTEIETQENDEIKFEMTSKMWNQLI